MNRLLLNFARTLYGFILGTPFLAILLQWGCGPILISVLQLGFFTVIYSIWEVIIEWLKKWQKIRKK